MYCLVTDTTTDLPEAFLEENHIEVMRLTYELDGETYGREKMLDPSVFYEKMRQGKMPTTSQLNPEDAHDFFAKLTQKEKEILVISFSSGLSGSYNSVCIGAKSVMEEFPDCRIEVIDSLCASMGEGMFVYKAIQLRNKGYNMDETMEWLEQHKFEFVHVFTVDDLFHLYRGGRVSKTAAVIGTLAGIKPMLHVDNEGHLINIDKIRGRKKSLQALVDYMEKKRANYKENNDIVMITHGDCREDAEYVAGLVRERLGMDNIIINTLGPVIGTHTGPGLIALFFMGENR